MNNYIKSEMISYLFMQALRVYRSIYGRESRVPQEGVSSIYGRESRVPQEAVSSIYGRESRVPQEAL